MKKKTITIAGNIIVDSNKYIDVYPVEGNLSNVNHSYVTMGGCVPNTSIVLKAIDSSFPIEAMGSIGNDDDGKFALNFFKTHAISIENIDILADHVTAHVDAYINKLNHKRTFFSNAGASAAFGKKLKPIHSDHLHVGYLLLLPYLDELTESNRTRLSHWLESISNQGVTISCDIVSEESTRYREVVTSALPFINYIIINEIEASKIADMDCFENGILNKNRLIDCAKIIKSMGVKDAVVIHSPELGLLYDGKTVYQVNSLDIPTSAIVNSVGAGDAFCAATLYGLLNGQSPEIILRLASCVAADVLMSPTPKPNLTGVESFLALEKKFRRR